ncbi:hypothetical protein QYE76_007850 [Lolium multiflorum]|uniref:Retrotransposon Copia-like N-terminal domain-containing protein n=1 Tax=Lolium multiflorum TaxID=4521 RepID=A0AAD8QH43_LOLMU|nr:hypothetical protein QYE76_007850 [Lolium multiflorum]
MSPDELKQREADLQQREDDLKAREAELARQADAMGKQTSETNPIPASTHVASIKTHVPITLDLQDSNYAKWRELFLVALGRYGLTSHVINDNDATPSNTSPTSEWARDDYTVLSWIYGSISLELFGIIMAPGSTARQIWDAIDNLFRDNKKSRALALDAEFRNTPQGDMTITAYCAKLKNLSDALADVGETISDETLVLTVLRGLNEQYAHLRSFLPFQRPFPSFLQTRSALILEETQKRTDAKNAAGSALWASGNSIIPSAGGERAPPLGGAGRGNSTSLTGNGQGYRGGGSSSRGRGRGGRGRGRGDPWMFNPWTGMPTRVGQVHSPTSQLQAWQSARTWRAPAPGLLGPRPTGAPPQAYAAYAPAPGYTNTGSPHLNAQQQQYNMQQYNGQQQSAHQQFNAQQQLDPALITALNNMHFPNHEWYMDSGASLHMASDPELLTTQSALSLTAWSCAASEVVESPATICDALVRMGCLFQQVESFAGEHLRRSHKEGSLCSREGQREAFAGCFLPWRPPNLRAARTKAPPQPGTAINVPPCPPTRPQSSMSSVQPCRT